MPILEDPTQGGGVAHPNGVSGYEDDHPLDPAMRDEIEQALTAAHRVEPVVMYLSDARPTARVEQAIEEALAILGGEVVDREPPIIRSWFRRMCVRFHDNGGPETVSVIHSTRGAFQAQCGDHQQPDCWPHQPRPPRRVHLNDSRCRCHLPVQWRCRQRDCGGSRFLVAEGGSPDAAQRRRAPGLPLAPKASGRWDDGTAA
jgi:hypothetical protein